MTNELAPEVKAHLDNLPKPTPFTPDELAALRNHAYPAREYKSYPFVDEWLRLAGREAAEKSVTRGIFYEGDK